MDLQSQFGALADCLFEPDDIVEIRTLPGGKQTWRAAATLGDYRPPTGMNIYFGVNPRSRHGGTAADVALARCLFVDFDGGTTAAKALAKIDNAGLPEPTIVINSGHGTHCYWRLESSLTDLAEWSGYQKKLIAALGSDKTIHDPPRIMRLPGTLNVKSEPHVPCEIASVSGEVCSLELFQKCLPEKKAEAKPKPQYESNEKLDVDKWLAWHGVQLLQKKNKGEVIEWLIRCPGESMHTGPNAVRDCGIIQDASGKLGGQCFHSSCGLNNWQSLKAAIGPLFPLEIPERKSDVDLSGLNGTKKKNDTTEPLEFPRELFAVPGIIGSMIAFHVAHAPRPRPELSLAANIALVGTITGRKIRTESGMRTNIYCVGLAPSGSGKERPRNNTLMAFTEAGLPHYLGSENPASDAALISELDQNPALLIQIDEVSHYFSTIKNAGNNSAHLKNIFSRFLELTAQSENPCWRPKGYADAKKTKQIAFPHLCIFGASTPDGFWASVQSGDAVNGFLARMMVIEAGQDYPRLQRTKTAPTPADVVAIMQAWNEFMPGTGNLRTIAPDPLIVPIDSAAAERLKTHSDGIEDRIPGETPDQRAIWSRTAAMAAKLALIFAASRGPAGLLVTLADAEAAVRLANWCTRLLVRRVFTHLTENECERSKKRVMEMIRRANGITRHELTRRTQWLRGRREREEILTELLEAGLIDFRGSDEAGPGRKAVEIWPV